MKIYFLITMGIVSLCLNGMHLSKEELEKKYEINEHPFEEHSLDDAERKERERCILTQEKPITTITVAPLRRDKPFLNISSEDRHAIIEGALTALVETPKNQHLFFGRTPLSLVRNCFMNRHKKQDCGADKGYSPCLCNVVLNVARTSSLAQENPQKYRALLRTALVKYLKNAQYLEGKQECMHALLGLMRHCWQHDHKPQIFKPVVDRWQLVNDYKSFSCVCTIILKVSHDGQAFNSTTDMVFKNNQEEDFYIYGGKKPKRQCPSCTIQ